MGGVALALLGALLAAEGHDVAALLLDDEAVKLFGGGEPEQGPAQEEQPKERGRLGRLWLRMRRGTWGYLLTLGPCLFIGLTSALGSIGWFTAMTLENASYVKAVGQVEVIFTLMISSLYFRETLSRLELTGMAVIVAGVLLFLL